MMNGKTIIQLGNEQIKNMKEIVEKGVARKKARYTPEQWRKYQEKIAESNIYGNLIPIYNKNGEIYVRISLPQYIGEHCNVYIAGKLLTEDFSMFDEYYIEEYECGWNAAQIIETDKVTFLPDNDNGYYN